MEFVVFAKSSSFADNLLHSTLFLFFQVEWINQNYGDIHIAGTNIAFPSGTIDPWHALGVQNSTAALLPQPTEQSVFIEGTAHCADLYAPANSDPESLKYAREVIRSLVSKWLA